MNVRLDPLRKINFTEMRELVSGTTIYEKSLKKFKILDIKPSKKLWQEGKFYYQYFLE